MTNKFKQECKKPAYKNRLGKIEQETDVISNANYLTSLEMVDSCISNGVIIGNTNAKTLKINTLKNYDFADKDVDAYIGIKYDDLTEEYIKIGKYTIHSETNDKTSKTGEYNGLDSSNKLDSKYVCSIEKEGNWTILDFYIDVCKQVGLTPKKLDFINSDIPVSGNPFTNNESCRIVLQNIAQVFCTFLDIDWETNEIDLIWFDEEVSDEITKDDYSTLEKNQTYGPVNCLCIKESAIEGENVVRQDEESISVNGECQISIEDNYFLYTEELRTLAIDAIWERLKGFTYVDCKITSYTGKPYLKRGNKITVQDDDESYFNTYVLKHTFTYDGTYKSVIESPALTKTQTALKNTQSITSYFRKVERVCNKIDGKIEDTIEKVNETGEQLSSVTQTVGEISETIEDNKYYVDEDGNQVLISDAVYNLQRTVDGTTSSISITNGNNIFRNAIGLFQEEYWEGVCKPYTDTETQKESGQRSCWLLQNGSQTQSVELKNGHYTVSFIYKKLIPLAKVSIKINDDTVELTEQDFTDFSKTVEVKDNTLKIEIISDTNDSCYILNLMGNVGDIAQPFSNNPNETVTDTVKIGQGLEISSNTMNTTLSANADGVRIKNSSSNEVITEFTDKGIVSKDLEATGTSKISGLLIMQVDDHVWLTGLGR